MDEKRGKLFHYMGIKYLSVLEDMRHISFGKLPKKIFLEKHFTENFIQLVKLPIFNKVFENNTIKKFYSII